MNFMTFKKRLNIIKRVANDGMIGLCFDDKKIRDRKEKSDELFMKGIEK